MFEDLEVKKSHLIKLCLSAAAQHVQTVSTHTDSNPLSINRERLNVVFCKNNLDKMDVVLFVFRIDATY